MHFIVSLLSMAAVVAQPGPNLLTDPGFEDSTWAGGSLSSLQSQGLIVTRQYSYGGKTSSFYVSSTSWGSPWKLWTAAWGSGNWWALNSTTTGREGTYNLSFGASAASCGVYQEVAVEPGKTYRLEALMKFSYDSSMADTWIEIEVLPQAFNGVLADDPDFDGPYKMYGSDPKAPGQKAPVFDWRSTTTMDHDPDWDFNDYGGLITATGDTLTVVLKAGGIYGPSFTAYYDSIRLYEIPEPASLLLAGLGATGLAGSVLRRRRRSG